MSESRILVRLLRMYFPRNWEFGSALSKFRNFGGGFEHPKPPPLGTSLTHTHVEKVTVNFFTPWKIAFFIAIPRNQQASTVLYSTVQYYTVQYSTIQYSTIQYSTIQYSTIQYSTQTPVFESNLVQFVYV